MIRRAISIRLTKKSKLNKEDDKIESAGEMVEDWLETIKLLFKIEDSLNRTVTCDCSRRDAGVDDLKQYNIVKKVTKRYNFEPIKISTTSAASW